MKRLSTLLLLAVITATAMAQSINTNTFTMAQKQSHAAPLKANADNTIIMEQPAGNLKKYTRMGGAVKLDNNSSLTTVDQSGYAYIVFATDGSGDVWLKDPVCWFNTGAWVKGKLSTDKKTITVPTGQHLSVNSQGLYLQLEFADVTTTTSGNSSVVYNSSNTTVTYTIDDNVIHLQNAAGDDHVLAVMWSDDHSWQGYADWSTAYIDEDYNPENPVDPTQPVTVIPENLETNTCAMMLFDLSFGTDGKESGRELIQTDVLMGMQDGKVYIQGLSGHARQGWAVGTINDNTITIPSGQYQGTYSYNGKDYPIYLLGCDEQTEEVKDIIFNYDPESGTLELADGLWVVDNSDPATITTAFGVYDNILILPEGSTEPVIPADLETSDYAMMLFDLSFGTDGKESGRELIQAAAKVGFKDGKVYIQGLSGVASEGWVIGTVDGTTVTIPSGQYQGTYNYNGTDYDIYLLGCNDQTEEITDIVFNYDPETGTLELADGIWIIDSSNPTAIDAAGVYDDLLLLKGSDNPVDRITLQQTDSNSTYYNLQGLPVSQPKKGIFIVGGKKIIMK